ncbi:MAG: GNAT family N-acetyltransferase [Bacteroidota bacterium]
MATLEAEQGKGYGTALLANLLDQLSALPIQRIWCNARVEKTAFYERFGLQKTTQTFTKKRQQYVIMEKWIVPKYDN